MNIWNSIRRFFDNRPKAFVIDDTDDGMTHGVQAMNSVNVNADGFTDCKALLYRLRKGGKKYTIGVIHENGSRYKPQILSQFIGQIDPTIKLFIYKNNQQLQDVANSLT